MGELPIYTTKAHVFHIDPDTKKKWLPLSAQSVAVSFYHDSTRQLYRIISVDGTKVLVNSTLTSNMTFTKTSQKFGQWSDAKANTVFGLGFASEDDLVKFMDKFNEVKVLYNSDSNEQNSGIHVAEDVHSQSTESVGLGLKTDFDASKLITDLRQQLQVTRYENDKLKLALAQSSANGKKWEAELQTLRNNNARLTAALQESATNVEEWKKQLQIYRDENTQLRLQEQQHVSTASLSHLQTDNDKLRATLQVLESENVRLQGEVKRLDQSAAASSVTEDQLRDLQQQLSTKINELYVMNDSLAELLTAR